jgi:hypothetical protein
MRGVLQPDELKAIPVMGIAGNFAEHLAQAGEAVDFVDVITEHELAPKGIFPIYIPGDDSYLGVYPLSDKLICADFSQPIELQAEPEMSVLFDLSYNGQQINQLRAKAFSAFNDCSLRGAAPKISLKKNWGQACTGLSNQWVEIDQFSRPSLLDAYHIGCFLKRDNEVMAYGVDSPVNSYSYFYQKLINWITQTLNQQQDAGPLENLTRFFVQMNYPKQLIITLGATRYTEFGEQQFLRPDDQVGVFVYNPQQIKLEEIQHKFSLDQDFSSFPGSALIQTISNTQLN